MLSHEIRVYQKALLTDVVSKYLYWHIVYLAEATGKILVQKNWAIKRLLSFLFLAFMVFEKHAWLCLIDLPLSCVCK